MGKKTAETLYDWLKSNKTWLATMLLTSGLRIDKEETPELESTKFEGKTFVVTGTHQVPRHVIEKLITDNGGTLSGSVSKKTDYLVAGDDAGSKLAKAEEVNAKAKTDEDKVGIITLGELRLLIE
jgi:DNA ligase (NAD+)